MTDASGFDPIFTELVERHGCASSAVDMAICRSLAVALCADNCDPAMIERLAALLPKAKAVGPQSLTVEFVGPPDERLSRLSDVELATLEQIVAKMDDVPVEDDLPPTAEQIAFAALQAERDRLRERSLWLEQQWSEAARDRDRAVQEAKATLAAAVPQNAPAAISESPRGMSAAADNVVPIRAAPGPFDALAGCFGGGVSPLGIWDAGDPSSKRKGLP